MHNLTSGLLVPSIVIVPFQPRGVFVVNLLLSPGDLDTKLASLRYLGDKALMPSRKVTAVRPLRRTSQIAFILRCYIVIITEHCVNMKT